MLREEPECSLEAIQYEGVPPPRREVLMIWVYRLVAVGYFGYGSFLVLGDLPPHDGWPFSGWNFNMGLYLFVLPATWNLINSAMGHRFVLIRWPSVLINLGLVAFHIAFLIDANLDHLLLLSVLVASLVLLSLSYRLARSWGKAAKETKEAG